MTQRLYRHRLKQRTPLEKHSSCLQANYHAGLVDYLAVLTADVQYHETSIAYLQAVAQRYQDTVALFVALGGDGGTPRSNGKKEMQHEVQRHTADRVKLLVNDKTKFSALLMGLPSPCF